MKIACIGNMNNIQFTLCRYLRDKGLDAHLFLFSDEAIHFLPEADSYTTEFKKFTNTLDISKETLFDRSRVKNVKKILEEFDFFIGTDVAPALLRLINRKLDIFIPHGSDIYSFPFDTKFTKGVNKVWWLRTIWFTGKLQLEAIENCELIIFPDEYETHFPYRSKLKSGPTFVDGTAPMLYTPQYSELNKISPDSLQHAKNFLAIREKFDLIIFSHARQNGSKLSEKDKIHEKGNDKLIKGFAQFCRNQPNSNACLILFEYGMDIDSAKKLIEQESIESRVIWMPKMQRKEIMYGLSLSDISCGEFENSWLTCGVVNESLALNKPLLHFRDDKLYESNYAELYFLLNAFSEGDITSQIEKFNQAKKETNQKASAGSKWLEKYTVNRPVHLITEKIQEAKSSYEKYSVFSNSNLFLTKLRLGILTRFYRAKAKFF